MNVKVLTFFGLLAIVMITAMSLIYTQHQSRKKFVELQQVQKVRDDIEVEWGRLQLEQGAWTTHGRVEQIARSRLNMEIPAADSVVIISP